MAFTHLHIRSGYSLMQSTITIEKLIHKAKSLQFDALALTDEHVLYGVIPFYKACLKAGIKPIIGMSVQVEVNENVHEVVLHAKNNQGYQNLMKLSTAIQLQGLKSVPIETFGDYTEHLIGILSTNHSVLKQRFLTLSHEQLEADLREWRLLFGDGDFYLGVIDRIENETVNQSIKAFTEKFPFPAVAICDVRYLDEKDDMAFDLLQAMKKGKSWDMKISTSEVKEKHLRSTYEMEQSFGEVWPALLKETENIKERCNVTFDFSKRYVPSFPLPPGEKDAHSYLETICYQNLQEKYQEITVEIKERLEYELHVIKSMQFSDYFLIVQDFIGFAKNNDILVGPGRGSSAGSIVAYVLGITDVDPMKYNLLFERFLNPERQTMPDIDVDFSDVRRDEVIEYVREKYGTEHVAQIITFGTFQARSLIREMVKIMNVNQQDTQIILKNIPVQTKASLADLLRSSKDLKEYVKQSNKLKVLFAIAIKLEGIPRHTSTHAAGVVISEAPLATHVPLAVGANETLLTQFTMNDLESLGLLKMDFLGLRNLTLLENILKSIERTTKKKLRLSDIPVYDKETFAYLQKGQTNGVFQLESQGMKQVLTQLKPTSFEDIVAVNALFRPGPMDFIPVYIRRKHHLEKVQYLHPDLEPILKETHGVLVYQEQIMQIAHRIAGFTLGQADILRRAVSKKKQDVMFEQKKTFIEGCIQNGYDKAVGEEIFSWIVKFSNYGFPRSHAVAYSKISYQLSYLKVHYPTNFFAELLSSSQTTQEKMGHYINEMKELYIELLPPSINSSFGKYTVEKKAIRMGLSQIKGVGYQAVAEIIRKRKAGYYKNLFDFCMRVDSKLVNRHTLENLIMAGTFDSIYSNRASLLASIDQAMEQGELFGEFYDIPSLFKGDLELEPSYTEIEDFSIVKKLSDEKELLGVYVSSHPLKEYRKALRANGFISLKDSSNHIGKRNMKTVGIIQNIKTIRTKRGESMAFITLNDEMSELDAVVFPDVFRNVRHWLEEEIIITVKGKVDSRNQKVQWIIEETYPFHEEDLENDEHQRLFIKISPDKARIALNEIRKISTKYPGNTMIIIYQEETKMSYQLASEYSIQVNDESLKKLKEIFGDVNVVLKKYI